MFMISTQEIDAITVIGTIVVPKPITASALYMFRRCDGGQSAPWKPRPTLQTPKKRLESIE
jgi:hypothetical protein